MPIPPEWYPAAADARITLTAVQEASAPGFEEAATPPAQGQLVYGVRFHQGESNPGYDLEAELVDELLADGHGSLQVGQSIDADRLNAAVDRALGSS